MAGAPALAGLILAGATIFLTSDWRLSLTGLLVQYILVGLVLSRSIQAELAIVKILVGVLAVAILYLSARRIREATTSQTRGQDGPGSRVSLGLHVKWGAGPLGLPLRLLTILLVAVAVIRFFDQYRSLLPFLNGETLMIPPDVAFAAFWLGSIGLVGLVLSGDPLRVAPALLTILAGFDLVYASLEPGLAIVGLQAALTLLAALAFSYLTVVHGLGTDLGRKATHRDSVQFGPESLSEDLTNAPGSDEQGLEL